MTNRHGWIHRRGRALLVAVGLVIVACGTETSDTPEPADDTIVSTTAEAEPATTTTGEAEAPAETTTTEATAADELVELTYSFDWSPDSDWSPVLWADELGYFEEEGISVDYVPGDPQLMQLLGAHQIDIAQVPGPSAVLAYAEGIPITVVGVQLPASPLVLLADADAGIVEPTDIEGHSVAVQVGEFEGFVWEAWAAANGVDRSQVEEVPAGGAADVLFVDKQVDVFMDWYTSGAMVELTEGREGEETLFLISDSLPMVGQSEAVHNDFLSEHPEAVAGFLDAWARGAVYAVEHPDETEALLLETFPELDAAGIDWSFARFRDFWDNEQWQSEGVLSFSPDMWEATKQILVEAELMEDMDISDMYTTEYLPDMPVMLP